MQYHPDKVAHLGEEFKAVAEEKMKEINAAYSHFKQRYGRA
jgi:DnaJ like chaperone protein